MYVLTTVLGEWVLLTGVNRREAPLFFFLPDESGPAAPTDSCLAASLFIDSKEAHDAEEKVDVGIRGLRGDLVVREVGRDDCGGGVIGLLPSSVLPSPARPAITDMFLIEFRRSLSEPTIPQNFPTSKLPGNEVGGGISRGALCVVLNVHESHEISRGRLSGLRGIPTEYVLYMIMYICMYVYG